MKTRGSKRGREREKKPQAPRKKSKIDAADGETKVKRLTLCRWFLIINILYTNCLVCKDLSSCSEPQLRRCMRKSQNRQLRNNRKNVLRLTSKRVWTRNSRNYMQAGRRWQRIGNLCSSKTQSKSKAFSVSGICQLSRLDNCRAFAEASMEIMQTKMLSCRIAGLIKVDLAQHSLSSLWSKSISW